MPKPLTTTVDEARHGPRYLTKIPGAIPPHLVLVHNRRPCDDAGFRYWVQEPTRRTEPCGCDWRLQLGPQITDHARLLPRLSPEQHWPTAELLPLDLVLVDERLLPCKKPPVTAEAEAMLRESTMAHWTPIFVVPRGHGYLVLDGTRRVNEARRRGATHVLALVGRTDMPVLRQYEALGLPVTARTLLTWIRNVSEAALAKVRRPWEKLS